MLLTCYNITAMRIFYKSLLNVYYWRYLLSRVHFDDSINRSISSAVSLLNIVLSRSYYKHMSNTDKTTIAKIMQANNEPERIPDSYCLNDFEKITPSIIKIFSRYNLARKVIITQNKLQPNYRDFSGVHGLLNYSDYELDRIIKLSKKIMQNCIKDLTYFS